MYEIVNCKHPDKIADRIAGAIVDLAYKKCGGLEVGNPRVAVEVLIGHGECNIINETDTHITKQEVKRIVDRIADSKCKVRYKEVAQDKHLADNQAKEIKCGDNGIFTGMPISSEQRYLSKIAHYLYGLCNSDGKYIIANDKVIICQSNYISDNELNITDKEVIINPLGNWTGGINVDSGATNRKLGSDMGEAITGGGLHGKDLSKADVSANIVAHLTAKRLNKQVKLYCAIGDTAIDNVKYKQIVEMARKYIIGLGGFEKFAEWGIIGNE